MSALPDLSAIQQMDRIDCLVLVFAVAALMSHVVTCAIGFTVLYLRGRRIGMALAQVPIRIMAQQFLLQLMQRRGKRLHVAFVRGLLAGALARELISIDQYKKLFTTYKGKS